MKTAIQGLEFEPESHTYSYAGEVVPGVTSVLEPFTGLEFVHPDVLAAASLFGTHVHDAVDLFNRGTLDEADLMDRSPLVWEYLEGWKMFLQQSGAVVIESEQKVFHPKLRYAGTLDSICAVQKTNRLYDVKSTASVPKTVGPQVAAYEEAYRAQTGGRRMKRYCVQLKPNKYSCTPLTDPRDWDIFKAALTLYRWRH